MSPSRPLPSAPVRSRLVFVRIVAGRFGGRRLVVPKDARVRPTAGRLTWIVDQAAAAEL